MTPGWRAALPPALLCGAVVVLVYGALLVPGEALAARDVPFLHLPLRTVFRALVLDGKPPLWDPTQHGGQPLLSNPHYAAFYPGTWLFLLLPPIAGIHASVLLHALVAFAGAWRLAAVWRLGRPARALAAVGYTANGAFAALPGTLLVFDGMAWLPWAWALAPWASPRPESEGRRPRIGPLAGVLALQMLNGDPTAVLVTWLGLGALALVPGESAPPWRVRWRALAGAGLLALLLAAIQIVPTAARLRESARGGGLEAAERSAWSTHPLRLLELFQPRIFGDPGRDEEGLYFGGRIHDKTFPFLQSIYPGCLIAALGLAGLVGGGPPLRQRHALRLAAALGLLLALGRHDPLDPLLRAALPFLEVVRYPEKFLLLSLTALVFTAAGVFDGLQRGVVAGRRRRILLLAAGAIVVLDGLVASAAWGGGETLRSALRHAALSPLAPDALGTAVAYLRRELTLAALLAAFMLVLVARLAREREKGRTAALLALGLTVADLAYSGRHGLPTVPVADLTAARPIAAPLLAGSPAPRLFTDALFAPHETTGGFRIGRPGTQQIETLLDALTPASGVTTGLRYVVHRDFDLMLTSWGRRAVDEARLLGADSAELPGFLAAWSADGWVRARTPTEQLREFRRTRARPSPVTLAPLAGTLPRWRFVPGADAMPDADAAFAAARARGFAVRERETLVGEPAAALAQLDGEAAVARVEDRGARIEVRYRAAGAALLVGAMTFDDGWRAQSGDRVLPTWPTALGQLAVLLPPSSSGSVALRFHDPWLAVGATLSALGLLGGALAVARRRSAPGAG